MSDNDRLDVDFIPELRSSRAKSRDRSSEAETASAALGETRASTALGMDGSEAEGVHKHDPERRCILTGERAPKDRLIRLALGPDGSVAPDVRARAPGRGAWIRSIARRSRPRSPRASSGRAPPAFKASAVIIPDDLAERIEAALRRDALDRLGLEARSGTLLTGSDKIADAARRGAVGLLIHAADASADGNRKLDQALRMGADAEGTDLRGLVIPADRTILSMALGRENVVHIALTTPAAAGRVMHALGRWRGYIGRDWAPEPCDAPSQGPLARND
jgi:hypothetical protein